MKAVAIIPARIGSTRLAEKPLVKILNKPMIRWVYEGTKKSQKIDEVVIATDSEKIKKEADSFGAKAIMTSKDHKTGTDRICEAVKKLDKDYDIVVNVQGDEPLIDGKDLDSLLKPFKKDRKLKMATPIKKMDSSISENKNIVKVVVNNNKNAMYFSRSKIPYEEGEKTDIYKHIGIYAYRKDFLLKFANMRQTTLEKSEKLEQLRALEDGYTIKTILWNSKLHGVDTKEDIRIVETILKGE